MLNNDRITLVHKDIFLKNIQKDVLFAKIIVIINNDFIHKDFSVYHTNYQHLIHPNQ